MVPIYSQPRTDSQLRALDSQTRSHDVSIQQEKAPMATDLSARSVAAARGWAQPLPQVPMAGSLLCSLEKLPVSSGPVSCVQASGPLTPEGS